MSELEQRLAKLERQRAEAEAPVVPEGELHGGRVVKAVARTPDGKEHTWYTRQDGTTAQPTIAELQSQVKVWTVEKGWADDRSLGDLLLLTVSEISEAYEEYRNWHEPNEIRVEHGKPEGIPIELADVIIRILSLCSKYDIDLQAAVLQKMAYNETREHRHGGKRI